MSRLISKKQAAEYLPHKPPMLFVKQLCEASEEHVLCETLLDSAFEPFSPDQKEIPAAIFLEIMAQTVAVWAGWHAREEGRDIQPGLILGCRDFKSGRSFWPLGMRLSIRADKLMEDEGTASFEAEIRNASDLKQTLASGTITAKLSNWEQIKSILSL